MLQMEHFAK